MVNNQNSLKTMTILLLLCMAFLSVFGQQNPWEKAGCHKLGYTREVSIPGCVKFDVVANACRGYCVSYAFPSSSEILNYNPNHVVTSRSECCTIQETHDVIYEVDCIENGMKVRKEFVFKSAASCQCSVCSHNT